MLIFKKTGKPKIIATGWNNEESRKRRVPGRNGIFFNLPGFWRLPESNSTFVKFIQQPEHLIRAAELLCIFGNHLKNADFNTGLHHNIFNVRCQPKKAAFSGLPSPVLLRLNAIIFSLNGCSVQRTVIVPKRF